MDVEIISQRRENLNFILPVGFLFSRFFVLVSVIVSEWLSLFSADSFRFR